jgi:hypothetical protein
LDLDFTADEIEARRVVCRTFIEALQEPAPMQGGNNFRRLNHFDRLCWRNGFPKPAHPETRKAKPDVQPSHIPHFHSIPASSVSSCADQRG